MLRHVSLLSVLILGSAVLGGCHLYLDEEGRSGRGGDRYDDCRGDECFVPSSCTTDEVCGEGCFCNEEGTCEEGGFCDEAGECAEGFECDYRNSCVPVDEPEPEPEPEITCQSEVSCDEAAPICPAGTTAAMADGCYTGECMAKADCPDGAPFECSDLNSDEDDCYGSESCSPVYKGVNCTSPTGADCTSGSADCTCESFDYDYCEES